MSITLIIRTSTREFELSKQEAIQVKAALDAWFNEPIFPVEKLDKSNDTPFNPPIDYDGNTFKTRENL